MLVPGSFPATSSGKWPGMSTFPLLVFSLPLNNTYHQLVELQAINYGIYYIPQMHKFSLTIQLHKHHKMFQDLITIFLQWHPHKGALPNVRPSSGVVRTSSLGCHTWHPHIHLDCHSSTTICITNASKWATNS